MKADEMVLRLKAMDSCSGLDQWIESFLFVQFSRTGTGVVNLNYAEITRNGWIDVQFKSAMIARGYMVTNKCEDRPCSFPYLEIRLPA